MRLDELPKHVALAIRGIRSITTKHLGRVLKGKNGKNLCRWCRGPLEGRRKSWCSDACVGLFYKLQDCPDQVLDFDKGKCRGCGCDVLAMQYMLRVWDYKSKEERKAFRDTYPDWFKGSEPRFKIPYAVDHRKPIWKNGTSTSCNLQILCSVCHAIKTSREATARAKSKRCKNIK